MCMALEKECKCGKEKARIHHGDSILPAEAIKGIYCPACSTTVAFDSESMIADNGWIVEYDMEVAQFYAARMGRPKGQVDPEFIFDEGFCCWQGFTPNDVEQANQEKMALTKVAREDPRKYVDLIRDWSIKRELRLQKEGWRKARHLSAVG